MNGPPDTTGCPSLGVFGYVLRAFPSPTAYCDQTCSGRIDTCWSWASAAGTGVSYVKTAVVASGASTPCRCCAEPAALPVAPSWNLRIVL